MASIEAREAAWRRHLQEQHAQYEEYDRNLSDKVSTGKHLKGGGGYQDLGRRPAPGYNSLSFTEEPIKKEKKEKKEKKDKDDKKEKKEKKEKKGDKDDAVPKVTYLGAPPTPAPTKVTYLGGPAPNLQEEAVEEEAAENSAETASTGGSPAANADAVDTSGAASPVASTSETRQPREIKRCLDLTWPDLVLCARSLLLKGGRTSAADLLEKWENEYGYGLSFPIFGISDWPTLVRELQPGALVIVDRKQCILQASSEAALAKERNNWNNLQEKDRAGTALEWLLAGMEKELKAVRQSLKERKSAQQNATAQADKIRQEYQALQANSKGQRTAQLRSTKVDLDKQEQRANKFRQEAEEYERQEKELMARISKEQKEADEAQVPAAAPVQPAQEVQPSGMTPAPANKVPASEERTPSAEAQRQEELKKSTLRQLKQIAVQKWIAQDVIEAVDDADDPKQSVIDIILRSEAEARQTEVVEDDFM